MLLLYVGCYCRGWEYSSTQVRLSRKKIINK